MHTSQTIAIQEVRRDLPGFFQRLRNGEELTVISRSKPLVTVQQSTVAREDTKARGAQFYLDLAAEAAKHRTHTLDQTKSIKQLYRETMAEKYDIR